MIFIAKMNDKNMRENKPQADQPQHILSQPQIAPKRKWVKAVVALGIGIFIIISTTSIIYYLKSPQQKQEKPLSYQGQYKGKYETVVKKDPQQKNMYKVFLVDPATKEEVFFANIPDVYEGHYHESEFYNGQLYIIRRIGYDGYPDEDWTDELWRYDESGEGKRLYTNQGLDFRAAPNNQFIAIESHDNGLVFLGWDGNKVQRFSDGDLKLPEDQNKTFSIAAVEWSDDGLMLWGNVAFTAYPQSLFRINVGSWKIEKFPVPSEGLGSEYRLNPNNEMIVYSTHPVFFTADSREDWIKNNPSVTLKIFDILNQTETVIASSSAKSFRPTWIDETSIEYKHPVSGEQTTYSLIK